MALICRPSLDGSVQAILAAFRDHVVEHLQHAPRATLERGLQEHHVTLAAGAARAGSALVDGPKATQRKRRHASPCGVNSVLPLCSGMAL